MLVLIVGLSGCGPERPGSGDDDPSAQTRQIALDYQNDGDLPAARAALSELDVANANQWLVLVAETAIAEEGGSAAADALAQLVHDLGLTSSIVMRYAERRGIIGPSNIAASETPTQEVLQQPEPTSRNPEGPQVTDESVEDESVEEPVESSPTSEVAAAPSTPEPTSSTVMPTDTPSPIPPAQVQAVSPMNVRAGPSTNHPIIGALQAGNTAAILAKNNDGDWWQIELGTGSTGWIYGPLVETVGDVAAVSVAASIPTVPPATPTPVPQPTPTPAPEQPAQEEPTPEQPAQEEPPQEEPPQEEPTPEQPAAPPPSDGPDFQLVEQRLWDVEENGGFLAGTSVNCGEKQVLQVIVEDANGSRLNGVTIKGVYRNELHVTGEKGDGVAELDMNKDGDDIMVVRDVDGREVSSDRAVGNTARTWDIPYPQLIQGRYCSDDATCQAFVDTIGCFGHFSWTVRFRRSY